MEMHEPVPAAPPAPKRARQWNAVLGAALPSLRLTGAGSCDPAARTTRLGGVPLVSPGCAWPRTRDGVPLALVGQVHGGEVNAALGTAALPAGMLLSFFFEADEQQGWGYDPTHSQYSRVIAAEAATAETLPAPNGVSIFPSVAMTSTRVLTVPDSREVRVGGLWRVRGDYLDQAEEIYASLSPDWDRDEWPPRHRVFGWPDLVQGSMQEECQLAANGVYVGDGKGYRGRRAWRLRKGVTDWLLLFQVDTDDDLGWMWGDVGTLYYWIRRQDLVAGDFDRVWTVLQCH